MAIPSPKDPPKRQHPDTPHAETTPSSWAPLYRLGGAAALISVLLVLLDILISMLLPEGEVSPGARSASDWFALFEENALYGLRDLGLLNILNMILGIPLFLALYAAQQRTSQTYAMLAAALFLIGGAIYISNNTTLPMLALSGQYAAASTDSARLAFMAAGEAMLARGADFTFGSLIGFLLPSLAQIGMSLVTLWGGNFSRAAAYTGIIGFSCLLVFTVWTTFLPQSFELAMWLAMPGGFLAMAWNILVARRLFGLGRELTTPEAPRMPARGPVRAAG